jgi:hypothetical protein
MIAAPDQGIAPLRDSHARSSPGSDRRHRADRRAPRRGGALAPAHLSSGDHQRGPSRLPLVPGRPQRRLPRLGQIAPASCPRSSHARLLSATPELPGGCLHCSSDREVTESASDAIKFGVLERASLPWRNLACARHLDSPKSDPPIRTSRLGRRPPAYDPTGPRVSNWSSRSIISRSSSAGYRML